MVGYKEHVTYKFINKWQNTENMQNHWQMVKYKEHKMTGKWWSTQKTFSHQQWLFDTCGEIVTIDTTCTS